MAASDRYREIVQEYSEPLYWHIRRLVVSHEDAQDILQDTLLAIYRNLWQLRDASRTRAWAYRIATNKVNRFFRRRSREVPSGELYDALCESLAASEYVDWDKTAEIRLQKAVMRLTPHQQTVFNLRYHDDMDYAEMSRVTGSSPDSLKVTWHTVKNKIKEYLENEQ